MRERLSSGASSAGSGAAGRSSCSMWCSENSSLPTTSNRRSAFLKPSRAASSSCLRAVLPSRCSSFSTSSRPLRDGLRHGLRIEPGAHLGARSRAGQVAEFGVQPIERRAALLDGDDLDRLAIGQRRVQRHHGAVDARAAAAVAEVGVQHVGKVDRRRAGGQLDHGGLRREDVDAFVGAPRRRAGSAAKSRSHASNWRSTALRASAMRSSSPPAALTPA